MQRDNNLPISDILKKSLTLNNCAPIIHLPVFLTPIHGLILSVPRQQNQHDIIFRTPLRRFGCVRQLFPLILTDI